MHVYLFELRAFPIVDLGQHLAPPSPPLVHLLDIGKPVHPKYFGEPGLSRCFLASQKEGDTPYHTLGKKQNIQWHSQLLDLLIRLGVIPGPRAGYFQYIVWQYFSAVLSGPSL